LEAFGEAASGDATQLEVTWQKGRNWSSLFGSLQHVTGKRKTKPHQANAAQVEKSNLTKDRDWVTDIGAIQ
jgi:hypothetical protein